MQNQQELSETTDQPMQTLEKMTTSIPQEIQAIIDNTNEIICIAIGDKIQYINGRGLQLLDCKESDIIGKSFFDLVYEDDKKLIASISRKRDRGESVPSSYSCRFKLNSGRLFWGNVRVVEIKWKGTQARLGYVTDITAEKRLDEERERMKAQLLQAERLEAIGVFAGGIAHEISQPLNGLKVLVDGILYFKKHNIEIEEDKFWNDIDFISEQLNRISDIITQMKVLTVQNKNEKVQSIDINNAIQSCIDMQSDKLKRFDIEVILDLDDDIDSISGNLLHFEQILINLIDNSIDALCRVQKKDKHIAFKTFCVEDKYLITIHDNGPGIDDKMKDFIFDPFITTKTKAGSIGFGLSIVKKFISKLGGNISVRNALDGGAVFTISLPIN